MAPKKELSFLLVACDCSLLIASFFFSFSFSISTDFLRPNWIASHSNRLVMLLYLLFSLLVVIFIMFLQRQMIRIFLLLILVQYHLSTRAFDNLMFFFQSVFWPTLWFHWFVKCFPELVMLIIFWVVFAKLQW